jgi:hypothetical protein
MVLILRLFISSGFKTAFVNFDCLCPLLNSKKSTLRAKLKNCNIKMDCKIKSGLLNCA